jgi:peptidoglycan/LPS O-acetylase OafA/YrhL
MSMQNFAITFLTCTTAYLFLSSTPRSIQPTISNSKFAEIDGLRGILAFCVFIHHTITWRGFILSGEWKIPQDSVASHLGKSSVTLFFMITSFLFIGKLIDSKEKPIDWVLFFTARLMRLGPLYWTAILFLLLIVGLETHFIQHESPTQLATHILSWLAFTIPQTPAINGFERTSTIVAGVTWSLKYEWFFYFLVPLFSLAFRQKPHAIALLISAAGIGGIIFWQPHTWGWLAFCWGGAAAFLARNSCIESLATHPISSIYITTAIPITYIFLPVQDDARTMLLLGSSFTLVAAGSTIFGLLNSRKLKVLGEYSYGVYILQGIALYAFMRSIQKTPTSKNTEVEFYILVVCCTASLLGACDLLNRIVEKPAMKASKPIASQLTRWAKNIRPISHHM